MRVTQDQAVWEAKGQERHFSMTDKVMAHSSTLPAPVALLGQVPLQGTTL